MKAKNQALRNLREYRPYLPDSILGYHGEDEPWVDGSSHHNAEGFAPCWMDGIPQPVSRVAATLPGDADTPLLGAPRPAAGKAPIGDSGGSLVSPKPIDVIVAGEVPASLERKLRRRRRRRRRTVSPAQLVRDSRIPVGAGTEKHQRRCTEMSPPSPRSSPGSVGAAPVG
jgi:hypothetical protein